MLIFDSVTKIYKPHQDSDEKIVALDDVSFEIKPQEFVSVVGKSGAGKTTLLKLILGEEKATSGRVLFEGEDVGKIKSGKLSGFRQEIGAVFQDYKLLPSRTIFENPEPLILRLGRTLVMDSHKRPFMRRKYATTIYSFSF